MMKCKITWLITAALFVTTFAAPLQKREVPQEHSHEKIVVAVDILLKLNNPLSIVNAIFGLLGDGAAAAGAGKVTNLACLQHITADIAFTNAKKNNDIEGMTFAILYAALERNTGAVGKESDPCKDPVTNPEIDAIRQHQDPASKDAAKGNKEIVLIVAVQLKKIGADPQLAAMSATFAPGKLGDPTAAGNTCDDKDDPEGCIFTKKLIQVEATPEEITEAVNAADNNNSQSGSTNSSSKDNDSEKADDKSNSKAESVDSNSKDNDSDKTDDKSNSKAESIDSSSKDSDSGDTVKATGKGSNIQTFAGSLGGPAPEVTETPGSDRPFTVNGNTFVGKKNALQRSCDIQHNSCARDANSGKGGSVGDCEKQLTECTQAAGAAAKRHIGKQSAMSLFKRQALDFGSCSNPTVKFEVGLDGRKEASFQAVNKADFDHGSTQKLKITSDFICQQLETKCKAPKATVDICKTASEASASLSEQAAADAFNKAFGV